MKINVTSNLHALTLAPPPAVSTLTPLQPSTVGPAKALCLVQPAPISTPVSVRGLIIILMMETVCYSETSVSIY